MLSKLTDLLEKHRRFDEVGRETDESLELADAVVAREAIERAEKLESLVNNPGWKLIQDEMDKVVTRYTEALIDLRDEKQILQFQEFIKARKQLKNWISNSILEGKSFLEEQKTQDPVRRTG